MANTTSSKGKGRHLPALSVGTRTLPNDVAAEMQVIGACLLDGASAVPVAIETLEPDHFYSERARCIFGAIVSLFSRSAPIDAVTVREELRKQGKLQEAGGMSALQEAAASVSSSANIEAHSEIVAEKFMLRALISTMTEGVERCFADGEDPFELVRSSVDEIFQATYKKWQHRAAPIGHVVQELLDELGAVDWQHQRMMGFPTRIPELNSRVGGLVPGHYMVITGTKSAGKTALANFIARTFAEDHGMVDYLTLEMPRTEIAMRLIAQDADIQPIDIFNARLTEIEYARFAESRARISTLPIRIDDSMGMTPLELLAHAKRLRVAEGLKLLVVDYIQLMENPAAESREREVASVSRLLKLIAKELRISVIAISALSRLGQARDSGMIEYDADAWIHMENPRAEGKDRFEDTTEARGRVRAHVRKARTGIPDGYFELILQPSTNIIPVRSEASGSASTEKDDLPF